MSADDKAGRLQSAVVKDVPALLDESPVESMVGTHSPRPNTGLRRRRNGGEKGASTKSPNATTEAPETARDYSSSNTKIASESSHVSSLMGGMRTSSSDSTHRTVLSTVDKHIRKLAIWVLSLWVTLVISMFTLIPSEKHTRLSGIERNAAIVAATALFVSVLSRIFPIIWSNKPFKESWENLSGILIGAFVVQFIAFSTDVLLAFYPTPVVIDPILGTRVHILRWCEWTPCVAYMTFMCESADLHWSTKNPPKDFMSQKYFHAAVQCFAVFLGLLFPFCPGPVSWMVCMTVSCICYLVNFPRLRQRMKEIPQSISPGATIEEAERLNAAKIALRLRVICVVVWTIIVALFFLTSVIGPQFASEGSFLRDPSANMIAECLFDVVSKVLFMVVITDVHRAIFDPVARTERRLEELMLLLQAVWETSSDIIAISVRNGPSEETRTMINPSFFSLSSSNGGYASKLPAEIQDSFRRKSVLFNTSTSDKKYNGEEAERSMVYNIDFAGFGDIDLQSNKKVAFDDKNEVKLELQAIAEFVGMGWACDTRESVFSHSIEWPSNDAKQTCIKFEAKVNRLDENAVIVIIRDISERVRAFEAEKQILYETTSKQKDAEANRFTRHEVKNGLLSAMGLYESLCEAQRNQLSNLNKSGDMLDRFSPDMDCETSEDIIRCMNELGKSLQETLDTVLEEAMSRDLIHDIYRPVKERVDITAVLSGLAGSQGFDSGTKSNLTRFPLIVHPCPMTMFYLDPQLFRYLHRQALSNACKYGQTGGNVLTELFCDIDKKLLYMSVINLPGDFHDKLVAGGSKMEGDVFKKGTQIHEGFRSEAESSKTSSEAGTSPGDGGWIMQKIADVFKGNCSIKFEENRTVFTLSMPAKLFCDMSRRTPRDIKKFRLPEDIWGIAIDDSKIQRKLLGRFLQYAGIGEDRIKVFGKDSEEIMGFVDYVVDFMDQHRGDPVLIIADENLDVIDEASRHCTISGSQLVENIISRLLPEQGRNLVALIRSANDSKSDVAIYKSRAHGFLPKAPIKKAQVLETLAPLWFARYPPDDEGCSMTEPGLSLSLVRADSFSSLESSATMDAVLATSTLELLQTLNEIDRLFESNLALEEWDLIWEKLHALKGDLLTLRVGSAVITVVGMINSFRKVQTYAEATEKWTLLREHISSLVSS